tara:strand:- start:4386 stop:4901 length:516 start_codon:yes stop_codon:yes gene_type:complete
MAFTKVTTGGLSSSSNYGTHNINSTGIVTAIKFVGDGSTLTGVASTDRIITGTAATFTNQVAIDNLSVTGVVTSATIVATTIKVGTGITIDATSGVVTATSFSGDGSNLSGLASREFYGFTGIGSHLQLKYSNNGLDNISATDYASFEDKMFGPSGIAWSINNNGNLIATI